MMARSKAVSTRRRAARAPSIPAPPREQPARAWHVILQSGADETVTAQDCEVWDGVLSFGNWYGSESEYVKVRGFAAHAWRDFELVDINPHPVPDGGASDE